MIFLLFLHTNLSSIAIDKMNSRKALLYVKEFNAI